MTRKEAAIWTQVSAISPFLKFSSVTYILVLVFDLVADLWHHILELLPGGSAVPRPVNRASISEHQYDLVGVAAPHHIVDRRIELILIVVYHVSIGRRWGDGAH